MGIARSTYYDKPAVCIDDTALVETMAAISESFEAYLLSIVMGTKPEIGDSGAPEPRRWPSADLCSTRSHLANALRPPDLLRRGRLHRPAHAR